MTDTVTGTRYFIQRSKQYIILIVFKYIHIYIFCKFKIREKVVSSL